MGWIIKKIVNPYTVAKNFLPSLIQRIPLKDHTAAGSQNAIQTIDFEAKHLFEQCPEGYRANKSTLQYHFTDIHLILSYEVVPKEASTPTSEASASTS